MKPDEPGDALRALQRATNELLDERPDPRVRAAVLAAASRAVDARPRSTTSRATVAPFTRRRWPLSAAALLVVSLTTGLLVTRAMREEPDRVLTSEAVRPRSPVRVAASEATASSAEAAPSTREKAQAKTEDRSVDPIGAPSAEPPAPERAAPSQPQNAPTPTTSRRPVAPLVRQSDHPIDAPPRDEEARPPERAKVDAAASTRHSTAGLTADSTSNSTTESTAESTARAAKRANATSPSAFVGDPPSPGASDAASRAPSPSLVPSPTPAPSAMPATSGPDRARASSRDVASSSAVRESRATSLADNATSAAAARGVARGSSASDPATPEAWVERIMKLRAAGDDDAADRDVAALHARYPDFVIPAAARGAAGER